MTTVPWLTILGAVPLVGAIVVALLPRGKDQLARAVALLFSLATLALLIVVALRFDANAASPFQFTENHPWIPQFGISYSLGVDGIGLVLLALATTLVPVSILAGWRDGTANGRRKPGTTKSFFALVLLLETTMIGVFASTDVFLFYVFFEVMLIPTYFLIGRFGGPKRTYAAVKFLIYSLVGGLLMLASLIGVYVVSAQANTETHIGSFDFLTLVNLHMDPATQKLLFLGFFIAFAIKAPMWPLHTWLPDAAKESTPATAVLLIGVLDKVGTFGMIRYCLPIFPAAASWYAPVVIALAVIGILYGALVALNQTDMKRMFAYSSMSHFGFIVMGIFVFTSIGQSGAMLYMVAHGLSTAAVFFAAGYLASRAGGSSSIETFGGVNKVAPVLAGFLLFASMASVALPGLASFNGEFMVLLGTFQRYIVVASIATLAIVVTAAYMLRLYQKVATGPESPAVVGMRDVGRREIIAFMPIVVLTIFLGFYPKPVLDVVNPAVERTMSVIGATNPAPTVPLISDLNSEGTGQ